MSQKWYNVLVEWNVYSVVCYNELEVFQLDYEIFRTIANFIKISVGHSLLISLIFIKFFRTIGEIGGQMSWDHCLAESLS